MCFELISDTSSNIMPDLAEAWRVRILPLHYLLDDEEHACDEPGFDGHAFYERLRNRASVKTSMINSDVFKHTFEPVLAEGCDILYIGMSSGISGTVQAAQSAADELQPKYPNRKILVKDTLAASFGEGLFVKKASEMRAEGKTIDEISAWIDGHIQNMNQFFTVEDLMYLRHGGRISSITAVLGTLANIKPILIGDTEGKIAMAEKLIGRKKSLKRIADRFAERVTDADSQVVGLAHSDCEDDAQYLISLIRERFPRQEFLVRCYEPGTGAHVGPGAIALFFFGKPRGQ